MARVDQKIRQRKERTDHLEYHKHEQGVVRRKRDNARDMKRFGWLSVERNA